MNNRGSWHCLRCGCLNKAKAMTCRTCGLDEMWIPIKEGA